MQSPARRNEIIAALRRGTVPERGLAAFAVGMERFDRVLIEETDMLQSGGGVFKALRGEYGNGKTFFARWFAERAQNMGFAAAEVQISETETPLHKLETVYRRLIERLATRESPRGAFQGIVDNWFYGLDEDVLAEGDIDPDDQAAILARTDALLEKRLAAVSRVAPTFAAALRGYRAAVVAGDRARANGLIAWLSGSPNVAASIKRSAGIKGDLDHYGAMGFLLGLLTLLRDSGYGGLVLILDEVETLQRVRRDVRDKGLNALRQLMDEVDAGRFPGLYVLITGTGAFFDGPQGVNRLAPLAQRLAVDFSGDPQFDNPRASQIRLRAFDLEKLVLVGAKVRDLFADGSNESARIRRRVDNAYLHDLAAAVAGHLGGQVGIAPRIFLKKLVGEVLDRVEQFPDFDPRQHYALTISDPELELHERQAAVNDPDDIELDL